MVLINNCNPLITPIATVNPLLPGNMYNVRQNSNPVPAPDRVVIKIPEEQHE